MSTLTNYVTARCIKPAAGYLVQAESIDAGIIPDEGVAYIKFDESFDPSREWKDAVIALYAAMENQLKDIVMSDIPPEEVSAYDVEPWAEAWEQDDLFAKSGWAHRIINLMMGLRELNGDSDLGDHEFHLIMRTVRSVA